MENIANVVTSVLESKGWRGKVLEQMAVELWPEVVGDVLSRHTVAEKFRGGTLYVRSRSPMWSQELHFHQDRVVARLNGRLKAPLVQRIRASVTPPRGIKVGALKPNWEDPTFPANVPVPVGAAPDVDEETLAHARGLCAHIEDEDMRRVMERVIAASLVAPAQRTQNPKNPKGEAVERAAKVRRTPDRTSERVAERTIEQLVAKPAMRSAPRSSSRGR
jgi:hypothetical protein